MDNRNISDIGAERRMRYEYNALEIRAVKNQQWAFTYYINLVFVGFFGFSRIMDQIIEVGALFFYLSSQLLLLSMVFIEYGKVRLIWQNIGDFYSI